MRNEDLVLGDGLEVAGAGPGRRRWGCSRFRVWTRGRVTALLAMIGLPWLPAFHAPPGDLPMLRAHGEAGISIVCLAFSADGRTIALADERGRARLRTTVVDRGIERDLDVRGYARVASFSPDGRYLAIGRDEPDIVLHDLGRGGPDRPLGIPVREAKELRFSRDGRTLAVSSYRSRDIILWDLEAGKERMTLRGHTTPVTYLAFTPDGRELISAGVLDPVVFVWDLGTGRPRRVLTEASAISSALSPDGHTLATASADMRAIRFWDLRSGGLVRQIPGLRSPIRSVALSPDGRLVATGSTDQILSLWSVATGREIRHLDARGDVIRTLAFSPDSRTLAATGNDGYIRLWDVDSLRDGEGLDSP